MSETVNALLFTELMDESYNYGRALGAYRIATSIRNAGYTCQVIDFFTKFTEEEMDKIIEKYIGANTILVGYSSTFFTYVDDVKGKYQQNDDKNKILKSFIRRDKRVVDQTLNYPFHYTKMQALFAKMRKKNPKLKVVLGGAKATNLIGAGNAFMIGYADQAIVEYMKYLEGKNPFFQFERHNEHQIIIHGAQYSKFDFQTSTVDWHPSDHLQNDEVVPIELARGCIFKCKFCAYPLNGKNKLDHIKSDSVLRDEFLKNYNEYGITKYIYCDDTHNDSC